MNRRSRMSRVGASFVLFALPLLTHAELKVTLQTPRDTYLPFESIPITIVFENTGNSPTWIRRSPMRGLIDSREFELRREETGEQIRSLHMWIEECFSTPSLGTFVSIAASDSTSVALDLLSIFDPDRLFYGGPLLDAFGDHTLTYTYKGFPVVPPEIKGAAPQGPIISNVMRFHLRQPTQGELDDALRQVTDGTSVTRSALQLLAIMRDTRATPALVDLLSSGDEKIRRAAMEAANRWKGSKSIVLKLIEILESDPSEAFRSLAAESVGFLRAEEAIPALERATINGNYPGVAVIATRLLLQDFASTKSLPVLREAVPRVTKQMPDYAKRGFEIRLLKLEQRAQAPVPRE